MVAPAHPIKVVAEVDGEIRVRNLPVRKGETVEGVLILNASVPDGARADALQKFLERTERSTFKSEGPYPTRDALHERG